MIKIELSNEINGLKNEYELDLYNNHYKKSSIIFLSNYFQLLAK